MLLFLLTGSLKSKNLKSYFSHADYGLNNLNHFSGLTWKDLHFPVSGLIKILPVGSVSSAHGRLVKNCWHYLPAKKEWVWDLLETFNFVRGLISRWLCTAILSEYLLIPVKRNPTKFTQKFESWKYERGALEEEDGSRQNKFQFFQIWSWKWMGRIWESPAQGRRSMVPWLPKLDFEFICKL